MHCTEISVRFSILPGYMIVDCLMYETTCSRKVHQEDKSSNKVDIHVPDVSDATGAAQMLPNTLSKSTDQIVVLLSVTLATARQTVASAKCS